LLLLDEPLAGLDPERSERTLAMLARLIHHTQVPTIIVSHHHAQLLRLTDQVAAVSSDSTVRHDDTAGPVDNCSLAGLAVNRLPLRVASHHPAQGITRLTLAHSSDRSKQTSRSHRAMGNPLAPVTIAATYSPGLPVGRPVVGLLESQQIVLSLAPVETVSMQNRLRGRIHAMRSAGSAVRCGVELDVGGRCMVTITRQAAADFQLHAGMVIWCLFKATALTVAEDLSQASLASTLQPRQEEVDRPVDTATTGRALPPAVTAT
jgi:molybdate transport system ATP-binding protein